MNSKRTTLIGMSGAVVFAFVLLKVLSPRVEHHALGYILFQTETPNWFQNQCNAMSNELCGSHTIDRLAAMSQVAPSDFKLTAIRPIRGTSFIGIEYSGASSNVIQRVASNSCELLITFYGTNDPSVTATNFGARSIEPPSVWDLSVRRLKSLLP